MITVRNLKKSYLERTLFENADLQINNGDRFAIVGANGAGKSTFFKILTGLEEADEGEISLKKGVSVGYLPQENPPLSEKEVLSEVLSEIQDPSPSLIASAKAILFGLGFKESHFSRKLSTLSGGWAMRAAMAKLLLKNPDLLLLDEPTNHLDLESALWFRNYLYSYRGAVLMISHDRAFINYLCEAIIALENKTFKVYRGNYEKYLEQAEAQKERLISAYKRQQEEIRDMEEFIARNRARASTAGRAQSMIKRLEKMEKIELPTETAKVKIRFPQPRRSGDRVITLRKVSKFYQVESEIIKVYENLDFTLYRGTKNALVGPNGAGKSTLLKILAGVLKIDSGNRDIGVNVDVGYFSQHRQETLDLEKTVLEEVRRIAPSMKESELRTALGSFLFRGDDVFKKIKVLSGGEKSRLSLLKILLNPPNALFLDEPTTHLDMNSCEALISALKDYSGTLCFISHDLYFINSICDNIIYVKDGSVKIYPGNYDYFDLRRKDEGKEENKIQISKNKEIDWDERKEKKNEARRKERRMEDIEKKLLPKILDEIKKLGEELSKPEVYGDYSKAAELSKKVSELQRQKEALESELLSLIEEDLI
jgi:ATP-binding cassette subfamily F protein 3